MQHITHGMLEEGGALGRNACRNVFQRGGESEPSAFHATSCAPALSVPFWMTSFLFPEEENVMST